MPEPETPVTPLASTDVVADESRSPDAEETKAPSLFERIFKRGPQQKPEGASTEASADTADQTTPSKITLTTEELDRRVQAETDRREAKRQRDAVEKAGRDRREAIERKLDPNSPEYDPYAGTEEQARLKAESASGEQFTSLLSDIGKQHDSATLDVLVEALPETERNRIFALDGAGIGLDGRKLIVSESLKALEKHWRQQGARDAEDRLRGNSAFRKQVFAEARDQVDEPELLPANGAAPRGDPFMSDVFKQYRAAKGRRS